MMAAGLDILGEDTVKVVVTAGSGGGGTSRAVVVVGPVEDAAEGSRASRVAGSVQLRKGASTLQKRCSYINMHQLSYYM